MHKFRVSTNRRWSAENWRHHARYLKSSSHSFFGDGQGKSSIILWKTFLVANVSRELVLDIVSSPWVVQTLIATRSTKFASKKESNNVMVMGATYELHPDIKSSLIPTSASLFPCYDYILVSSIITARVFRLSWASGRCSEVYQEDYFQISVVVAWEGDISIAINESQWKITSRSTPYPDFSGGGVRGVALIAINENHQWEP